MKKILFPTEFSNHASQVFLYALDLAKKHKAKIILLHAYHVPINPTISMEDMSNQALQELMDFASQNTPKEYESVEVQSIAEMGFAAEAILKISEEENIDLIVMGMKGKTNALEAYFGSVAMDIVSRTDAPVFLVPSTNRFKPLDKVALAFDLNLSDVISVEYIFQLLPKLKAEITMVHIEEMNEDWQKVDQTFNFLEDLFKHHPKYKNIKLFNTPGKFEKQIHYFLMDQNIDLLITESHKRNWKFRFVEPSSSNRVAMKINIPMLILKEKKVKLIEEEA